ncbi:unnamed protein product [Dracunculus medinensis]|uniref:Uncharacterized protein n=1 Tax=Dracunculus medinensis TaxID=318479 RepID=A0A3P7SAK6_DRAME|nr:unnamed protein product [Dracunculus medinensis]
MSFPCKICFTSPFNAGCSGSTTSGAVPVHQYPTCHQTWSAFGAVLVATLLYTNNALYARMIYGTEFADHLWGLPEPNINRPSLDVASVCLVRVITLFFITSAILRNSSTKSCIIEEEGYKCYQRRLRNNHQFQQLLLAKDNILNICIRNVKRYHHCQAQDISTLRSCLCSSREELENRLQASVLRCVRQSEYLPGFIYHLIIDTGSKNLKSKELSPSFSSRFHERPNRPHRPKEIIRSIKTTASKPKKAEDLEIVTGKICSFRLKKRYEYR